jgi:putative membrane protein insertion efficiency factor
MIRRALRTAGTPVRTLEIGLIRVYRATLSGWLGGQCRFYPTCSHYAEDAIRERGAVKGTALGVWRILRCNPFGAGGVDHVHDTSGYDDVTREADRVKA